MCALLAALLTVLVIAPALAASLPMANGYGAADAPRNITPEALGKLFCEARISGEMTAVAAYFAPKLKKLLAETSSSVAIPWQSRPERPTRCDIRILNGFRDTVGVLVQLSYQAGEQQWSDTLNLERTPASWRLNNVFYEGGGNLRFRLFSAPT